ncbi:Hypothetical protein FKW44_011034 [Caligus rogercresseyi]|uniref:Uncharacterized protein n=1 Tax=Caligus rogercresseyi TaxID=217165 RepID=A0A7T8HHG1_CALRO|nr:Hypothetical protein FKW44_011034 [Caligus rogercresseyi]
MTWAYTCRCELERKRAKEEEHKRLFQEWLKQTQGRVPLDGNSERKMLPAPDFTAQRHLLAE